MAWCAPSHSRSKAHESSRVQVFHCDQDASDSYSDSSDYVEEKAPSSSFLPRIFKPKKGWQNAAVQVYKRQHNERLYIHRVRLQSPQLKEALRDLLERYGLVYRNDGVMVESVAPHRALYFVRHHVAELAKMSDDNMTRTHCSLLSDIIQEIFRDKFAEIETLNREERITFELLWTLFPEGSTFGTQLADEVPSALKVNKVIYDKDKADIKCEKVMFNGYCFRRYLWNFVIHRFEGEVGWLQIPTLPYIDLECNRELRGRLIERGRKALDFQSPRYMEYDPEACLKDVVDSPWVAKGLGMRPRKQRVVVDFFLARKRVKYTVPYASLPGYSHGTRMAAKQFRRPVPAEMATNSRVVLESEDNLLIMSPCVACFCLSSRTFFDLEIDALKPIERDENAMEKMVFDETKKAVVKILVDTQLPRIHNMPDREGDRALVILTLGGTGTGKTLMAECLADYAGMPLLKDWKSVLATFEEARAWGACILAEMPTGLSPLYAAHFAKQLESFNGIVIVSAVSKMAVPHALSSRARFAINLQLLTYIDRKPLLEFLNKQLPVDIGKLSPEGIEKLAMLPLNRHDIRNLLDVSVAWCRQKHEQISYEVVDKLRIHVCMAPVSMPQPARMGMPPPPLPPPGRPAVLGWMAGSKSSKKKKKVSSDSDDDSDDDSRSERSVSTVSSEDGEKSDGSSSTSSRD
ncbi:hypothetical protein QBC40DRAFT_287728 [Triangularia verruculosa]|uniref:DUF7025 domain-containing protein n=1 Tax=Triangularia verruculosa TaxID=2587418 RepID=A0AAN6X8S9_9PEZI|nr:hypothetical protein QBC40DRAFT_287728 [Triangularia verruculosa]